MPRVARLTGIDDTPDGGFLVDVDVTLKAVVSFQRLPSDGPGSLTASANSNGTVAK